MELGIDIQNGSSQICYFDADKKQPVSICAVQNQYVFENGLILSEADKEQFAAHIGMLISHAQKELFLPKPEKICITVSDFRREVLDSIADAMEQLGFCKEDWTVSSHEESYAYYAFSQKKELYSSGVMLLDYEPEGLYSHYMTIIKKNGMEMIPQESHFFDSQEIAEAGQGKRALETVEKALIDCITQAVKDKMISSIYLTGPGFEVETLPKELTHVICARRKAFTGQNLFVKGACFCAAKQRRETEPQRLLACHHRITTGIEMDILERGETKRFRLVKPGVNWYQAGRSAEFILEDVRKIPIFLRPCDGSGDYEEWVDISEIPYRSGKMTRIRLDIDFNSDSNCKLTITDLGFGAFVKSSGVVVEKELRL